MTEEGGTMDASEIERWVDAYVEAWGSNDPAQIGALFTEDAEYYTAPFRKPWTGREGIVAGWLERKDEPGDWEFRSEVMAVSDDLGFVRGWAVYPDTRYSNLWVIRMGQDGQCREFTEWWMEEK
jgi:ketosteroid isomerase-like protein